MGNELIIEVAGGPSGVRLSSFLTVARNTLDILAGIARNASAGHPIDWRVAEVTLNSPFTMTIRGLSEDYVGIGVVVDAYLRGTQALDAEEAMPDLWGPEEMTRAKTIVSVLSRDDVEWLRFRSSGETPPVMPTQRVAAHVDAILRPVEDEATYEGYLEAISVHGNYEFSIYDELTAKKMACSFSEGLLETAKAALGKRVSVFGVGCYDRTGKLTLIKAQVIQELPQGTQLEDFRQWPDIDIAGGKESAEYIRELRDD